MAIREELEFDIAKALTKVDRIEAELAAAAKRFGVGLADALGILNRPTEVAIDARSVTTDIDAAIQAADTTIVPDDTSAITSDIDAAVEAADGTVPVESEDAGAITTDIDSAVAAADGTVPVESTGEDAITGAIDAAVAAADSTVEITGDTSDLNAELERTSSAADTASESLQGTGSALGVVQGTSQLAAGDLAGVGATLGSVSARGSAAAGVFLAIAAAAGATVSAALESDTAQRRYNESLGEFADRVANPAIPGFADDLEDLAEKTGNSDESLKLAAARLFDLGRSADVAGPQVAATTEQVVLLATRASVLNPTLGDAGSITEALTGALARGGRTLNDYGLSITAAEIEARALTATSKRSADELTVYERAAAGAAIATERLGTHLRDDIVRGADQPAVALRRLREEFGNTLETFGAPLLDPLIEAAQAAQPVLLSLAEVFASLAGHGLPLLVTGLDAAAPAIKGVGLVINGLLAVLDPVLSLIEAIPAPVLTVAGTFLAVRAAVGGLDKLFDRAAVAAFNAAGTIGAGGLSSALGSLISPVGLVTVGLTAAVAVISHHNAEQEKQRKELEAGRKAFLDSAEATEKYVDSQIKSRIESKNQSDDLARVGVSMGQLRGLVDDGSAGLKQFADILVAQGEITRAAADDLLGLSTGYVRQQRASELSNAGNVGLLKSAIALQKGQQDQAKAALASLVAEERLTVGTGHAIEVLSRRADGTVDYVAAVKEANKVVEKQALVEIAAGNATETARAKNEVLAATYADLEKVLKATTEGTTASETALARYGPALAAAVDQYVRGKPSIEALAAIQAQFGIDTELLNGVIDEHAKKLAEAKAASDAWVKAGVDGLTSITEAGKVLDEDTSFQKYINRLQKTAQDQVAFSDNVAKLIARGADDIARNLIEQGISAAGFAAELTKTGDKRLVAQEAQLERTQGLFTRAETSMAANGTALVDITTATNTAISNVPPPDIAGPLTRAFDPAISGVRSRSADVQRIAATGGDEAGTAFALGFADGIHQLAPTATTEAETMARRTVEAAKRLLRAFSPSRVMMDLGGDVAEGLALGIAADTGLVETAAERMAQAAVPSLGAVTTSIPDVSRVVVADVVARSAGGTASAAPGGPAVVVSSGGSLVRMEVTFGPGADREGVTQALRDFAQGELKASLERVVGRVQMR